MKIAVALLNIFLALVATGGHAQETAAKATAPIWRDAQPSASETVLDRFNRELVELANAARPAIVQIRVTGQESKGGQPQGSRGSGFIIDPKGYILTAHHVIERAKDIEVRVSNAQRLPAHLIAADSQIDVALLKVQSEGEISVLPLGDSDTLRVGDMAIVFGYPFGRESSMNLGIISRSGRSYVESASFDHIQTDAGAYAGGSGGPLLNSKGHVMGMITMASERGNMGFATPINVIKRILPRLASGDRIAWGWLGVQMADVSLAQARTLGLTLPKGVVVSAVLPGQPAARGGIQRQDVILSINDNHVDSPRDVVRMVGGIEAGRVVRLTILRKGKTMHLSVPLGPKPISTKDREG
ncbi:MAG TPA: trypsin-like peptidase domain-containing protein [Terriglobales bacterium]|nr:trypsin-like peptidase domain-containing protein [Terriglobales bacterium]